MTQPGSLDLSFLHEDEASKILEVLDRDQELRRNERDRLRKLETSKRDVRWLHAVSGEWFEEIQKKKFKDDPDVRSLVTHHLKKKTPKGDATRMSSKTYQSPKSSNSGPSFLKLRSPFASLFSFRKSKHEVKLPTQRERSNIFSTLNRSPPSTESVKKKFEIYQSARSVRQIASFFESYQKKTNQNVPSDVQLQKEAFQVLGDLDEKLAQEQNFMPKTSTESTYTYGNIYSKESSIHNTSDSRKGYNTLSSPDRRTISLGETHSSHATYQPRRFYDMYSVRHHSSSETFSRNNYAKSPSLCSDWNSKPSSFAPISKQFSSSSLHLPSPSIEQERTKQQKPKRIPVTSIRWNKPSTYSQPEVTGRPFRAQSALDLTNTGNTSQQNRIFDLYKYTNSNRVFSPGCNDLYKGNYQHNLTCRTSQHALDKCSTEYSKTDSCSPRSANGFSNHTSSRWNAENKENSFKLNKVTSQPPCARAKTDNDSEPMEVINEYPTMDNDVCGEQGQKDDLIVTRDESDPYASSQTGNSTNPNMPPLNIEPCREPQNVGNHLDIPIDITKTSEIRNQTNEPVSRSSQSSSELEPMEVDVPDTSLTSNENFFSTSKDLPKVGISDQKVVSLSKPQKHGFYPGPLFTGQDQASKHANKYTSNNNGSASNVFKYSKPIGESSASSVSSTDIAGRLETHFEFSNKRDYRSDMLKHQKRNASSLPDLLEQENDLCGFTDDHSLTTMVEKPVDASFPSGSTQMFTKANTMYSGNNLTSQNFKRETEDSNVLMSDSLEKCKTFDPSLDRASKEKEQNTSTGKMTEVDGSHKVLHLSETASDLDVHKCYKSTDINHRNYDQQGADTNNNKSGFPKTIQTSKGLGEAVGSKSMFIDNKKDYSEIKTQNHGVFSQSQLFVKDESVTHKHSVDRGTQAPETEMQISKNILIQEGTNKMEQPQIQSTMVIPTTRIEEECLQREAYSKTDLEKKSLNLLKEHLLLAPEPYKPIVTTTKDSGDGLIPNIHSYESLLDDPRPLDNNSVSKIPQTSNTYTCQEVTERTQVYETYYRDSSKPDVDTIEYHKVVSIYYTLPRNYSRRLSAVSQNNLKNIDQTLENSQAPSSLLEKIINKCPKAEDNLDLSYQNIGKISSPLCPSEGKLTKEPDSEETPQNPPHNGNLNYLQTNLINKNTLPFLATETTSPDYNLVDQFSSLNISQSGCDHAGSGLQMQNNINESSPTSTSPRSKPNTYYTLPNRRTNLQDLERSILEEDVAMARNKYNLYSKRGNTLPSDPEPQEVFLSPTFGYDKNFTGGYNSTHFQERQMSDSGHFVKRDDLYYKDSVDNGDFYKEDIASFYKSKSLKDLNRHESHLTRDNWLCTETKRSPQSSNQPYPAEVSEPVNRPRPAYTSEFVQKKMKPINAKKFTFSFDNTGQREYSNSRSCESVAESLRQSDADSPSVFCSPKDDYPAPVNRLYYGRPAEYTQCQPSNIFRSKSLKSLDQTYQVEEEEFRRRSDGMFSSKSYGGNAKGRSPSGVNCGDGTHNRRYSAEMIIDENDNWPDSSMGKAQTPVYTAKAVDYGIFGKEQQEALLNNVKRSLKEGRLWRPSFLKNPSSLRNEEHCTSQQTGCKPEGLRGALNIYEGEVSLNSESETDTTTDDEYYLDENDKESEL